MDNLSATTSLVDWSSIKKMLEPGTQIDVQFGDSELPIAYAVIMALDSPIIFCRSIGAVDLSDIEQGATPTVFIPTARDLCSLRMIVRQLAENGVYLALSPAENASFLRRRRSIRIKTPENIGYRVQFDGRSNIYKGVAVQDISLGGIGLLVYAASPIDEGSQAKVEITLPRTEEQVSVIGVISHCISYGNLPRMYRVGIQFTRVSPRDKQIIAVYIDQYLDKPRRVKKT
ncbi:MAG: PilZ domain-containing protein [Firmicutes bacterium]|nr:PilZ domain-containing protein [Bacillota bacterium]